MASRAHQLPAKFPKLAGLMDDAASDVLVFMNFPKVASGADPVVRLDNME